MTQQHLSSLLVFSHKHGRKENDTFLSPMGRLTYNQKRNFDQTDWLVQSAQLAQSAELLRPVPDATNLRALMKPVDSGLQSSTVYPAKKMIPTQFHLSPFITN